MTPYDVGVFYLMIGALTLLIPVLMILAAMHTRDTDAEMFQWLFSQPLQRLVAMSLMMSGGAATCVLGALLMTL